MIEVKNLPPERVRPINQTPTHEKSRVLAALEQAKGNCVETARLLGSSRTALWYRLMELDLAADQ